MELAATIRNRRSSGRYGIMASLEDISYSVLRRYDIGAEPAPKLAERRCRAQQTTHLHFHPPPPAVVIHRGWAAIQAGTQY